MTQLNIKTLCQNISDTMRQLQLTNDVYDIDEIKDHIPDGDLPLLMVYPETSEGDTASGTQMSTFGGGANRPVQVEDSSINVDIYIAPVGGKPLQESLVILVDVWNEVLTLVREQTVKPYFGDSQVSSFQWEMTRVEFQFSTMRYHGIQLQLSFTEF